MSSSQPQFDYRALLKEAYLSLEKLKSKVDALEAERSAPLAVIGIGCRFPGGVIDAESFWRVLSTGVDAIREVPPERWDVDAFYDSDPDVFGKTYARWGGFVADVDRFDPQFFGIPPREAISMDPQQRLLLEVAWETLENAGHANERLMGSRTGVFVGISTSEYPHLAQEYGLVDIYLATGNMASVAAGRLSFSFGLEGPSISIDTACSSSLVSVHLAMQALRNRECNLALAGGVNLTLFPYSTALCSNGRMLSRDGRCKTFDVSADGYVRGEGCGMVALKRLDDALADGDHILAVLRGSAVNQDGRTSGLTTPNGSAQERVQRAALASAGLRPDQVSYLEAHGTGTSLGDPIEAHAAASVYGLGRPADQPLLIGSVKTNIGHLEIAAGIAGLIKVILALGHEQIPPHLNLQQPTPHIPWDKLPLAIPTTLIPWPGMGPRFAAVNSFGIGGTNAHVVVEQAPQQTQIVQRDRPCHLLPLSARREPALRELAGRYLDLLSRDSAPPLAEICHTAAVGRSHFKYRLAVTARSADEMRRQLTAFCRESSDTGVARGAVTGDGQPKIAFVFGGSAALALGDTRELFEIEPTFRQAVEQCSDLLSGHLPQRLLDVLYPPPANAADAASLLMQADYAEAAAFSIEYALAQVWASWGIRPSIIVGHGAGDCVAACVAEAISLGDALKLAVERARLKSQTNVGADRTALVDGLRQLVAALNFTAPRTRLVSGATAKSTDRASISQAEFWAPSIGRTLPLADSYQECAHFDCRTILDFGIELSEEIHATAAGPAAPWRRFGTFQPGAGVWQTMLDALAQLYAAGCQIDWVRFDQPWQRRKCALPTYPFQRASYWVGEMGKFKSAGSPARDEERIEDWLHEIAWEPQALASESSASNGARQWVVFGGPGALTSDLRRQIAALGERCAMLVPGAQYAEPSAGEFVVNPSEASDIERALAKIVESHPKCQLQIVYLWPLETQIGPVDSLAAICAAQEVACSGALGALQSLDSLGASAAPRIWLVTRGVHAPHTDDASALAQAPLWGLGRAAALELPTQEFWLLDLSASPMPHEAALLLREMTQAGRERQIAYRQSTRHVARFARAGVPEQQPISIRPDASYLITGGLGALGLLAARWLVARGARHVALVGRREPNAAARATIDELTQQGATIVTLSADLAEPAQAEQVVRSMAASLPPLRGIIHAAGVLDDGLIVKQDWARFQRVLAPKLAAAWNLHVATRQLPLDFFMLYSSVASVLGSPGQSNYAAANAALDALAGYRRALGLRATTINWGPWSGAGMAADTAARGGSPAWAGWKQITPALGALVLDGLLAKPRSEASVLAVDWNAVLADVAPAARPAFFDRFTAASPQAASADAAQSTDRPLDQFRALAPAQRRPMIESYLRDMIARSLGITSAEVPLDEDFVRLGLDSLMIMKVVNGIRKDLNVALQMREAFDRSTVKDLAELLLAGMGTDSSAPDAATIGPAKASPLVLVLATPRSGYSLLRGLLARDATATEPLSIERAPLDASLFDLESGDERFDQARFIHLVRHPLSVIESCVRSGSAGAAGGDPSLAAEDEWARVNGSAIDFLAGIDPQRHHRVTFEDLVREPARVIEDVLHFLGAASSPPTSTNGDGAGHAEQVAIDASRASAWETVDLGRPLGGFARRLAHELGYKLPAATSTSQDAVPLSPVEQIVVGLWADVLGREPTDIHARLVSGSGAAALVNRFAAGVRDALGLELPHDQILVSPTVADISLAIVSLLAADDADAVLLDTEEAARGVE